MELWHSYSVFIATVRSHWKRIGLSILFQFGKSIISSELRRSLITQQRHVQNNLLQTSGYVAKCHCWEINGQLTRDCQADILKYSLHFRLTGRDCSLSLQEVEHGATLLQGSGRNFLSTEVRISVLAWQSAG